MAKRALVTGCNGFVGGYLCAALLADGYEVHGVDLQEGARHPAVHYARADLSDEAAVRGVLVGVAPEEVYHLAAVANPREAKDDPSKAYRTSVLSALALLDHCRRHSDVSLLIVGSSEQYAKKAGERLVLAEGDPLDSSTVYGSNKIIAESIAMAYHAQFGVKVFLTRSFNHSGPGQSPAYVLSDFAKQCAEISLGLRAPELVAGDVDLERDFMDVRDVVQAYRLIVGKGRSGAAYNVSSGSCVSLRSCAEAMLTALGLPGVPIRIDPSRVRGGEPRSIVGDHSLLTRDTGWEPERSIGGTVVELARDWRDRLVSGDV